MNIRYILIGVVAVAAAAAFTYSAIGTNQTGNISTNSVEVLPGDYIEDVHYRSVEAATLAFDGKVKVQELFWYGCPHCEKFEPSVLKYKKNLPGDAELVQIPVVWNEATRLHAAFFYLATNQNAPEDFHAEMFKKIISLRKEGNLAAHIQSAEKVFAAHGLDTENFKAQLQSPDIQAQLEVSTQLMETLQITGTPTLAVDGAWVVLNNADVSKVGVFEVVDHLIAKSRAAR